MAEMSPLDPHKEYTATLTGEQWIAAMSALTGVGGRLVMGGNPEKVHAGMVCLDVAAEIVKQIDPEGWEATHAS
jgi:hypothetical protein